MATSISLSDDQATAHDSVTEMLRSAGIDLDNALMMPSRSGKSVVMAITGKAGSGKTLLLAELYKALENAGLDVVSGEYESRKRKDKRTLAILAPTNKAASVLRLRGVPATTIHRILPAPNQTHMKKAQDEQKDHRHRPDEPPANSTGKFFSARSADPFATPLRPYQ